MFEQSQPQGFLTAPEAVAEIVFELSPSKHLIERRVYNLFDWMNEVGGFFGFVQLLIQIVIPFC